MKKTILKFSRLTGICLSVFLFFACSEDKGNYTYDEKNILTIDGIPDGLSLLAGLDYLDVKPTVTSSVEGVIASDNENFSFSYQYKKEDKWVDMGNGKDLHWRADLSEGSHPCRFVVTDKRNEVQTIKLFYVKAQTLTTEGWLVLCNEGEEEVARMDMLSQISTGRVLPMHNVVQTTNAVPVMHRATDIGVFFPNSNIAPNVIAMLSEEAAYAVPVANNAAGRQCGKILEMDVKDELKSNLFIAPTEDHLVNWETVACAYGPYGRHSAAICVSKEGNAYAWNTAAQNGSFEHPINTSKRASGPEYRVAPYIGICTQRPLDSWGAALLYDIDNHRFVGWGNKDAMSGWNVLADDQGLKQVCYPLPDPENKKFSFQTGDMDLVCMLNTAFNGEVCAIMQDGNKRHIYVVSVMDYNFEQVGAYLDVQAPDFDKATCFAASSTSHTIYYGYKNKIYAYNYAVNQVKEMALNANEEVTMLKFCRYDEPRGSNGGMFQNLSEEDTQIYLAREKQLIVGTYDNNASDTNGGILRFYDAGADGALTLLKDTDEEGKERVWEFKGFAKIKDVAYKEVW